MYIEDTGTSRLVSRSLHPSDLPLICQMHEDEGLMSTLGGTKDLKQSEAWINKNLDHWEKYGYGMWLFFERTTEEFIGRCGIRHVEVGGNSEIEVGYALIPDHWGKGYATEMAKGAVQAAFQELELEQLVAFTMTSNIASRRVMEKIGFSFERDILHHDLEHVLYRLDKDTWSAL